MLASGVICRNTYEQLRAVVTEPLSGVPAYVFRLDGAVVAMSRFPDYASMVPTRATSASVTVVQPEIFEFWSDYTRLLKAQGFVRTVFIASHAERAYRFAEDQAELRAQSDFQSIE